MAPREAGADSESGVDGETMRIVTDGDGEGQ